MDISLHHIANIFRTYDATITMLLCSTPEQTSEIPVPGPKSKKRSGKNLLEIPVLDKPTCLAQ
jgi:hypothetical protein